MRQPQRESNVSGGQEDDAQPHRCQTKKEARFARLLGNRKPRHTPGSDKTTIHRATIRASQPRRETPRSLKSRAKASRRATRTSGRRLVGDGLPQGGGLQQAHGEEDAADCAEVAVASGSKWGLERHHAEADDPPEEAAHAHTCTHERAHRECDAPETKRARHYRRATNNHPRPRMPNIRQIQTTPGDISARVMPCAPVKILHVRARRM